MEKYNEGKTTTAIWPIMESKKWKEIDAWKERWIPNPPGEQHTIKTSTM